MWLYLKTGFYSVSHERTCKEDELLVGARCKKDIDKLKKLLKDEYQFSGKVVESLRADYAFSMIVPREVFALFMAVTVLDLKYDNFKNITRGKDFQRYAAYTSCWQAMYKWQKNLYMARKRVELK